MGGSKATIPLLVLATAFGVTLAVYLWPLLGPQVAGIGSPPNAAPPSAPPPSASPPSAPPQSVAPPLSASTPSPPVPAVPAAPIAAAPPAPAPAAQAPAALPAPQTATSAPPQFDVVRVEPSGEAVIAGKGAPNAKMEALASGKVVGEATADGSGQFVILPPPFRAGDYDLTLRQTVEGKAADSTQSVAVSVPAKGGEVVVALAEPGKPTRLLGGSPPAQPPAPPAPSTEVANAPPDAVTPEAAPAPATPPASAVAPPAAPVPPPPAKPALAIRSVELENGNGFFVTGTAAPDTRLQIYLNASHLADVVTGADGQWSLTIKQGLTAGHYAVRADAGGAGGAVTARAEVPFDVPAAMADAKATAPPAPPAPPAQADAAPSPPSAPNPTEVAGLGPEKSAPPPAVPLPRPDIAAAVPKAPPAAPAPATSSSTAPAPTPVPAQSLPPATATANAVIEQVETAVVVRGDNLWNISRARLGHGRRFTQIYEANASQIRDPRLIYPGQVFVMPKK